MESYTSVSDESVPTPTRHAPLADRIAEESDGEADGESEPSSETIVEHFVKPSAVGDGASSMK